MARLKPKEQQVPRLRRTIRFANRPTPLDGMTVVLESWTAGGGCPPRENASTPTTPLCIATALDIGNLALASFVVVWTFQD